MRGITRDTLAELVDRRLWIMYAVILLLALFAAVGSAQLDFSIQMSDAPDELAGGMAAMLIASAVGALGLFIGFLMLITVMLTANTFPNQLTRGRAEFVLSKPMSRSTFFVNKYLGVLVVYGGIITVCALAVGGTLLLVHESMPLSVLAMAAYAAISFAVWLGFTSLCGVITRSTVWPAGLAILMYFAQRLLALRDSLNAIIKNKLVETVVDALYYALPKFSDMSDVFSSLARGQEVTSWMAVWSSALSGLAMIAIALWIINRRDF